MKTNIVIFFVIISLQASQQTRPKVKRGYLTGHYDFPASFSYDDLGFAQSGWKVNTGNFNLNVDLPSPHIESLPISRPSYGTIPNLKTPIDESQEYIPPPSNGIVVLPQMPVPAVPVNAVASNVPASRGATFLGSGSIGVVNLGNGVYALGSGSIGYSENRSRPRPKATVPAMPIQATPDLLPAAVPTAEPLQPVPAQDFRHPLYNVPAVPQINQNGYEYLPPNRVGFGDPLPPRPPKTRQQFATPTNLQIPPQQLPPPPPPPTVSNNIQFSVPYDQASLHGFQVLA